MIHHPISSSPLGDHYAVGVGTGPSLKATVVLAQLQQHGEQVRVMMTADEARHFAQLLVDAAEKVEADSAA